MISEPLYDFKLTAQIPEDQDRPDSLHFKMNIDNTDVEYCVDEKRKSKQEISAASLEIVQISIGNLRFAPASENRHFHNKVQTPPMEWVSRLWLAEIASRVPEEIQEGLLEDFFYSGSFMLFSIGNLRFAPMPENEHFHTNTRSPSMKRSLRNG